MNRRRREVEQASDITEPVDRVVLRLRSDHSKEVPLWEVVRGRDNGPSSRPSLLSSHMCHVAGALEIQYNTIVVCYTLTGAGIKHVYLLVYYCSQFI